jgi:hypothetical protein
MKRFRRWMVLTILGIILISGLVLLKRAHESGTEMGISLVNVLIGGMLIGTSLFGPQLRRWLGVRRWSDHFTVPRFRRAAQIEEVLSRVSVGLLGIGLAFSGAAHSFSSSLETTFAIQLIIYGSAMLIFLITVGVNLANRHA